MLQYVLYFFIIGEMSPMLDVLKRGPKKWIGLVIVLCTCMVWSDTRMMRPFHGSIQAIRYDKQRYLQSRFLDNDFNVFLKELVYVRLTYWGFDKQTHVGALIVHKDLAKDLLAIFAILYQHHFPIESMQLMDAFNDDDAASMAANNTSSFNFREVTGHPGIYSQHSYGRAIDINPMQNPYVKSGTILPAAAHAFVSRHPSPGKITRDSLIYHEFTERGWDWGGNWYDVQDYQHFEKRANGAKRNPFGY
jgi:hypothetical protein